MLMTIEDNCGDVKYVNVSDLLRVDVENVERQLVLLQVHQLEEVHGDEGDHHLEIQGQHQHLESPSVSPPSGR